MGEMDRNERERLEVIIHKLAAVIANFMMSNAAVVAIRQQLLAMGYEGTVEMDIGLIKLEQGPVNPGVEPKPDDAVDTPEGPVQTDDEILRGLHIIDPDKPKTPPGSEGLPPEGKKDE